VKTASDDEGQTEHLPIDKAAYEFCLWWEQVARGFSRYHKRERLHRRMNDTVVRRLMTPAIGVGIAPSR
jgi:hypothetical protein